MSACRPNPSPVNVICLGLSRTGTTSLSEALTILGFGPCYHTFRILQQGRNDYPAWFRISDGLGTASDLDEILGNCRSVLDEPAAIFPAELYAAYPDAKFILTVRDPARWAASMEATVFRARRAQLKKSHKTELQETLITYDEIHLARYHNDRLYTHTEQAFLEHNERVKRIIPPEKLLVYQVGEGWDRLSSFLGVLKPEVPFPHLNEAAYFQEVVSQSGLDIMDKPGLEGARS